MNNRNKDSNTFDNDDDDEETTLKDAASCRPALSAHPTALAFFAALDSTASSVRQRKDNESRPNDDNNDNNETITLRRRGRQRCSEFVQKRILTTGWRNRHSQDEYYPVTVKECTFSVKQVQRGEIEGTYGTGACVWPAAIVLLKYLECHSSSLLADKQVVDLGSGTGITSVAAALLGAKHVVCTDGSEQVVRLAKENLIHAAKEIELTKLSPESHDGTTSTDHNDDENVPDMITIHGCQLNTQLLWWGQDAVDYFGPGGTDIVLVADCVLPKLYPIAPLVDAINELLVKPDAMSLLSYEHRYYPDYDPRDKFRELAEDKGLVVEVVPMEEQDPVYSVEDIEIWKVGRRKK